MKSIFIKRIMALSIISATLLTALPIGASATVYTSNTNTVYADNYQWENRNGFWMCATPDFHQGYANAWICTNGKWYYINKYGCMLTNTWVDNYYVDDTGAWIKTR